MLYNKTYYCLYAYPWHLFIIGLRLLFLFQKIRVCKLEKMTCDLLILPENVSSTCELKFPEKDDKLI